MKASHLLRDLLDSIAFFVLMAVIIYGGLFL